MRIEDVAKVCYEAYRAYRETQGDHLTLPWEVLTEDERLNTMVEVGRASMYSVSLPASPKTELFRAVASALLVGEALHG